jgi:hypothetical protein
VAFGHYRCCTSSGCACAHPREPRRGSSDLGSHPVVMLLFLRKKRGEKPGMRRTYFRSGPLLDRAPSGQSLFRSRDFVIDFVTSGQKDLTRADMAQLPVVHAQNILQDRARDLCHFRHVTNVTSGHVTSGSTPSQHPLKYDLSCTPILLTVDVNIHASNRQIWYRHPNKENTKVRPEITKFKMSREKVNMDFYFVGIIF